MRVSTARSEEGDLMTNQHRNRKRTDDKEAAQGEVAKLGQVVEKQSERLEALAAKVELVRSPEDNLRSMLSDVRDQLLRRSEETQASLYDLQLATSVQQRPPHATEHIAYQHLIRRIREVVRTTVPFGATVLVVSRGDDELLNLYGRQGWHFPQNEGGVYAGYYPYDSKAAIIQLEVLRARGAEFLLFPQTALWWLDKYAGFKQYLEHHYQMAVCQEETCVVFALREPAMWANFGEVITEYHSRFGHNPTILDWNTGLKLVATFPECTVFSPPTGNGVLPYIDDSIDLVAVASSHSASITEAHRVAAEAVVKCTSVRDDTEPGIALEVDWKSDGAAATFPTTSIIIPCYNGISHTETCLTTLRETLPVGFRGEILVVDDGSTDETSARLEQLAQLDERLKVVRNLKNVGFTLSCNRGANVATGEILVFLNNDTILLSDWLPPLLRIFRDYPDAGAVGGKLILPDGTLQEVGGVVFRDGSAANLGRAEQEIEALSHNYVREVDYCSAALLATRRSLFEELDGFDMRYAPAYYEDTDYCFAVREAGYKVYCQPESAIIHLEGATSGMDTTRGVKRYQIINQEKFAQKWSDALKRQPIRPSHSNLAAWQALAMRSDLEEVESR
jgi:GT2 family glycosyltransferase